MTSDNDIFKMDLCTNCLLLSRSGCQHTEWCKIKCEEIMILLPNVMKICTDLNLCQSVCTKVNCKRTPVPLKKVNFGTRNSIVWFWQYLTRRLIWR